MTIKVRLPNGTVVECDTPEEAARFVQQTSGPACGKEGCSEPPNKDGPHCGSCGNHHFGMC